MLEYGGKTGGAVTTKLYGAGGDMILLNDCFDHNDDGVDSSNLCAVRVLIIWVSWSNIGSNDTLSALSPLLDRKPCGAKMVFVRPVTNSDGISLDESLSDGCSFRAVERSYSPLIIFGDETLDSIAGSTGRDRRATSVTPHKGWLYRNRGPFSIWREIRTSSGCFVFGRSEASTVG